MQFDIGHHLAQGLVLLVVRGQADAVGQLRVAVQQRLAAKVGDSAPYIDELLHAIQVAVPFIQGQRQQQVFPHPGAHGPDGQFLGVLDGKHGDGGGGVGPLDLQQQVEPADIGAVEMGAEHVDLLQLLSFRA
ncbi:hypothetical protein FQZ97_798010 [compost metagenome]